MFHINITVRLYFKNTIYRAYGMLVTHREFKSANYHSLASSHKKINNLKHYIFLNKNRSTLPLGVVLLTRHK